MMHNQIIKYFSIFFLIIYVSFVGASGTSYNSLLKYDKVTSCLTKSAVCRSIVYGVVSIFDYDLAEYVYGEQAEGMRNMAQGLGNLVWDAGGSIGYMNTQKLYPEFAKEVYGEQYEGFKDALTSMSGGEGQSAAYRTGYVGSQLAVFYLLGKYGNKQIGGNSVAPKNTLPLE